MKKSKKHKMSIKTRIIDHLIQAILIFASVLLAFYITKVSDNYKTSKKKEVALENIRKELNRNLATVEIWQKKHVKIANRINDIAEGKNDSLKTELLKHDFFNLGILLNNEGLIDEFIYNTAWETSKTTGIISEFDFETTQDLNNVYFSQKNLLDGVTSITDLFFNIETHRMENFDAILFQFRLRFGELIGREQFAKHLYEKSIISINKSQK